MTQAALEIADARHIPPAAEGAYPLRPGNAVHPLVDGEPAFRRICEAVEAARQRVWVTVAFLQHDVPMPDGRGSFFDVLDRAAARGIEVRALFWREPRFDEVEPDSSHFPGNAQERAWLSQRGSRFLARWDRHPSACCHHQKCWIVDAGEASEIAFVGGINLLRESSLAGPGHPALAGHQDLQQDHDVYVEVRGPAASDVHHNFVQRWNEASERGQADGCWPEPEAADDLSFPHSLSRPAGEVPVQLTRTIMPGMYSDATATPGGKAFPVAGGEKSALEQYLSAIGSAQQAIYVEDQAIASPVVVEALRQALERGVYVVFLVPGNPHPEFAKARRNPRAAPFFEKLAELGGFENFTLAAISASRGGGRYDEIYVHAKIMLVDDAWATIGSTNVADRSFHKDTELNASFWHAATVRALRVELLSEHLGRDTADLSAREALAAYARQACANRQRRTRGEALEGLVYAVDPALYGG